MSHRPRSLAAHPSGGWGGAGLGFAAHYSALDHARLMPGHIPNLPPRPPHPPRPALFRAPGPASGPGCRRWRLMAMALPRHPGRQICAHSADQTVGVSLLLLADLERGVALRGGQEPGRRGPLSPGAPPLAAPPPWTAAKMRPPTVSQQAPQRPACCRGPAGRAVVLVPGSHPA